VLRTERLIGDGENDRQADQQLTDRLGVSYAQDTEHVNRSSAVCSRLTVVTTRSRFDAYVCQNERYFTDTAFDKKT